MKIALGRATAYLEVAGNSRQRFAHQVWGNLYDLASVIYLGAVICKDLQRLLRWELDADLFQDCEGRCLQLVKLLIAQILKGDLRPEGLDSRPFN
jgi:hypothetical protein